jgi:glycosyltransferase involved in cell wall biosynthesis
VGRSGSQDEEGSGVVMRVAWFGHAGGRRADGLTAYSDQTVTALAAAGCEIRFFHHDLDGDSTPVADVVALEGVRFKTVTLPAPRTLARIERALADFRPDVVHCSVSVSLLDGAVARVARGLGAATVATCHLPYASAQSARGRVMRRLYHYHAAGLQEYDRCIALSNDQRDLLVRVGVAPERIVVMPNAVDTARICPGPSALKQALGAELMVSFLARRWPSDHLLVIAGSGSQDRRLRAIAGPEGPVRFLGMVTRMEDRLELLRATDLFVLPSTAEGLSLALLEAMAAGCAIVATDAGEHRAVLAGAGDGAGLVIPVYPLEPALGEAMERLRGDPAARRRLGEAARSRVVADHSLDAYVADLLGLYASAAAGHEVGSALR